MGASAAATTKIKIYIGLKRIEAYFSLTPFLAHICIKWLAAKQ